MKVSQKEAVFQAVVSVLTEAGFRIEGDVGPAMTRELRAQVNMILFEGFRSGAVKLDREFTDSELKAYTSGLQSNWLRKDGRLNGGVKYTAKNPGSRAGQGDAQLKALRTLLSTQTDPSKVAEIQKYIDRRVAELKPKTVEVNIDDLPAELRAKYTSEE